MKILYILKDEPDETVSTLMREQGRDHELTTFVLNGDPDYDRLVDLVFGNDRVVSW